MEETTNGAATTAAVNFEEIFVSYLRYERNMSPETIRAYEKDLHQFLRFFSKGEGEAVNPARHVLDHEVKAITYHELKVERVADGWLAEVIVDI